MDIIPFLGSIELAKRSLINVVPIKLKFHYNIIKRFTMDSNPAIFERCKIRRLYDEETETWFFSVVDVIQALIQQPDYQAARNYWKVLKNRLNKEGSESVTKCNRLKLEAADGNIHIVSRMQNETVKLTINQMAELFGVDKSGISHHLKNVYESGELDKNSVVAIFATTASDGKRIKSKLFHI